jgi:CheY-like chemotaxis protein
MRAATHEVARVLVVDDDPASRLTLQTLLEAGGYAVDSAASAAEAVGMLDEGQYELVLSDLGMESPEAGYRVIEHARGQQYRPATAIVTTSYNSSERFGKRALIEPQDVPGLLSRVADLISRRAQGKVRREMRGRN